MAAVLRLALAAGAEAQAPTVPLPSDVQVTPPAVEVPPGVSQFAGAWAHGAWDGTLPHVLVVETLESNGRAQVVYALGDSPELGIKRGYRRVTGRIVANLLMFDLAEGSSVTYQLVDDTLRGTYASRATRSTVTLTRATLAEASVVPATVPELITGTTVRIPMAQTTGNGGAITLEATVYRPGLDGPSPVVLFNHGSTGGGVIQPRATLRQGRLAQFFAQRGFAVLAPMRRGRGTSEGTYEEYEGTCDRDLLRAGLDRGIADVDAAVAYLRTQAWVDPARLLIAGQSRGGILSVVYAAERPGVVRGAINFAGGWTSQRCDESGRGFNGEAFAAAGGRTNVPMLWLYAEEDSFYSATWIRRYHSAFTQAGGVATFQLFPAFGADGHRLVDHSRIWESTVDGFLRVLNLSPR